jgi:hypothetical protein
LSEARKVNDIQPWQLQVTAGTQERGDRNCIGVGEGLEPEHILRVATERSVSHLCQKNGHEFDKEMRTSNNLILAPDTYFAYPIASVFTPDDLSAASEKALIASEQFFDCSNQKRSVLESITTEMSKRGLAQTLIDDVVAVADEMFTNAVFNAPFVDKVTHINPNVSRNTLEIQLEDGKRGRLFLAHDESRLMIGCEDPYGSLSVEKYLNKVKATYAQGAAATMNFGPGGAGLGSYIIFNAGCSLYYGVRPGHATIICCVLPLGMSNRKRAQLPKHFHWIQL